MSKFLYLILFSISNVVLADSIVKIESNVVENLVFFELVNSTHKYGVNVDAKGGRYVFEHCGTENLIEGKHYTLSGKKVDVINLAGVMSSPATYYSILPGPECK